jgi:Uma2 family endonuclease
MQLNIEPPYLIVKPGIDEDEFYRLADEDSDWEYLDGRIVMHSPASNRHEDLFTFLITLLRAFVDERGGGAVRGSRYPMRLDANWSPEPDILVVCGSRQHLMTERRLEGPADLVIQIASESDPGLDAREKLPCYREAEIREMWFIDPFRNAIRVETKLPNGYRTEVLSEGRLECQVLPGFWIHVEWLWQAQLPSTLRCLSAVLGE